RRLVGEAGCTAANAVFFNGATVATCGSPYLSGNPALATITQISGTESTGKQRYDGLQASLTKRYSQGFQLQLSYTWSKTMTNSIGYYGASGHSASNCASCRDVYGSPVEWGRWKFDAAHHLSSRHE